MGHLLRRHPGASALALVRFCDPVSAAEAIARVGLAVASAHRLKSLALLARNAKPWNRHANAGLRCAFSRNRLAPESLVAAGDPTTRLPGWNRVGLILWR